MTSTRRSSRGGGWTPSRRTEIDPGRLRPEVLEEIVGSWGAVKKPSVVTFVVDISVSMDRDEPIEQVREGLRDIVDEMQLTGAEASQIGLVTFNDGIVERDPPAPLDDVGDDIGSAITTMTAERRHRALRRGGAGHPAHRRRRRRRECHPRRRRAERRRWPTAARDACDDIVEMAAEDDREGAVTYCAKDVEGRPELAEARDQNGDEVDPSDVVGIGLNPDLNLQHDDLKVFFLGFGDADINIGRILAGATGADFQESPDDGIAEVILELSGYF